MKLRRLHAIAGFLGTAVFAVAVLAVGPSRALAQLTPWPTPPPAPIGPFPEVVPANRVTPVAALSAPGSVLAQVDPIFAGTLPRIPPRPAVEVASGEADPSQRVTLRFFAGSLTRTVQLAYEPQPVAAAPAPGPGQRLLRVFRVALYSAEGQPVQPTFRYPVQMLLTPSPEEVEASGNDPARLLVARYDSQAGRWAPLLTTNDTVSGQLLVRLLRPGLFALIAEPAPVG